MSVIKEGIKLGEHMFLFDALAGLLSVGFSLLTVIVKLIFIGIICAIATFKGRSALLWGLITLILPWPFVFVMLLLVSWIPKKYPKLPAELRHDPAFAGRNPVIASIMALAAMVAKSDGNVTKEEIHFIKQFITAQFGIAGEELNGYSEAFTYGKNHGESYQIFTQVLSAYCGGRRDILIALAYLFIGIAVQEGENQVKETETRKILSALGVSAYEYEAIKRSFTGEGSYSGGQGATYSSVDLNKKYSEVLGVAPDASFAEIKKAYRKLVKQYHPDKLASESMPDQYKTFAEQKIREVNEAYEYFEKTMGHN